jgi:DNA-binding transcriptional LysR family regulator
VPERNLGTPPNLLVAFDTLFDELSVSRAAERLALTQPTVSGMLNRLRHLFGDPLLVRTQRGMLPTPRAESLAAPVKLLLNDAKSLVAPDTFDPATAEMTFSISVNDYMQYALVIPFIEALRRQAPTVRVAILPPIIGGLTVKLMRGELDLAITIPEFSDPDLPSILLYRERYVGIVRKQHALKRSRPSLQDFCRYDHLLVSPTGGSFTGPTDDALSKHGLARNVAVSLPSFHVLLDVVRTVDFVALVPERLLRGRRRDFRVFEPPISVPGFDVIACWHPRVGRNPAHGWLRQLLAAVAKRIVKAP